MIRKQTTTKYIQPFITIFAAAAVTVCPGSRNAWLNNCISDTPCKTYNVGLIFQTRGKPVQFIAPSDTEHYTFILVSGQKIPEQLETLQCGIVSTVFLVQHVVGGRNKLFQYHHLDTRYYRCHSLIICNQICTKRCKNLRTHAMTLGLTHSSVWLAQKFYNELRLVSKNWAFSLRNNKILKPFNGTWNTFNSDFVSWNVKIVQI